MNGKGWRAMTANEIAANDVAEMDLHCSDGLPGISPIDYEKERATLNEWVAKIEQGIKRLWPRRQREQYCHYSASQFRMLVMFTILQRDLGVHYDQSTLEKPYDARDARHHFIYGPLNSLGGTCSNLPVLFVAIGRMLGFPLHLVQAKEHLFVRWEDDIERFNMDATSPGFRVLDDEYFRHYPRPLTAWDQRCGAYLRNLSQEEIYSICVWQRGRCLLDNLQFAPAIKAFERAVELYSWHTGALILCRMEQQIWERIGFLPNRQRPWPELIDRASPDPWTPEEARTIKVAKSDLLRIVSNWNLSLASKELSHV